MMGMRKSNKYLFVILFFTFHLSLFTVRCFAEDQPMLIVSDRLEYFAGEKKYVASGGVSVERDGAMIQSDEMIYHEDTSVISASGNFRYDDKDLSIKAGKAEMNMEEKTGRLYDAVIFHKKGNYYLYGREIEKRGEAWYYSPDATFTTCDAPVPAWCFRAKEVSTVIGDSLTARNATFRIKNVPVLYTPYVWASISKERETGFLTPAVGISEERGLNIKIPFYWVISENRDATFVLDTYTESGIGTGVEYRFVGPGGVKSNWWAYHLRDSRLDRDFLEVRALHENRFPDRPGGFLNINYVNEKDFYREFSLSRDIRTQRFLESTGELAMPAAGGRFYLLSQYWVDLKHSNGNVPQKLPEAGYVLNYTNVGSFMFSASATAANIWREDGISARRLDIYPRALHSVGSDLVLTQAMAVRGTAYSFYKTDEDHSLQRTAFEYEIAGHTRLYRKYSSFTHVIEPSVRYHFISSSEDRLPVFDSVELFGKTSTIELSILNRGIVSGAELFAVRVTQALDTDNGGRPFLPLHLEVGIKSPLPFRLDATYNVYEGKIETASSDISVNVMKVNLFGGIRYNRVEEIMMYSAGVGFSPFESVHLAGQAWYDVKGEGLRDLSVRLRYIRQCWGVSVEAVKKPGDFTVKVLFELLGLTSRVRQEDVPDYMENYL